MTASIPGGAPWPERAAGDADPPRGPLLPAPRVERPGEGDRPVTAPPGLPPALAPTAVPEPEAGFPVPARPAQKPKRRKAGLTSWSPMFVPAGVITILGALLLGFVADITLVGQLRHIRDQDAAYSELRSELANGTTPVNQTGEDGALLPLGQPVGLLEIPSLGIREVVLEGTTSAVLRSGVGHRRDTPLPGQPGTSYIFGRKAAYGRPFARLDHAARGQRIFVTTGQGRQAFTVIGVRRAGDLQPPALTDGGGRLTLVTATGPDYLPTGTLRVDADLVSEAQPGGPRPLGFGALPPAEKAMVGEPGAWLPILLWAQGLAAAALLVAWVRTRWGRWQVWLAGLPLLLAVAVGLSDQFARLLPNVM